MAIRILVFLFCWALMAKDAPQKRTMATHRVVTEKAFKARRSQGRTTTVKSKKWKKNRRPAKANWGDVKVRPKH
jgi:hypothetical protein